MKVSVVILNFNGKDDTLECLESLSQTKKGNFEVETIVVDNASSDTSVADFKKQFPDTVLLVNSENLGFAEGNNIGIRFALKRGADFILILNNDTIVSPTTIPELLMFALAEKKGGIFGPKIYFMRGRETHPERYKSTQLGRVIWYAGGKMDFENVLASHRGVDEVDAGQYDESVRTSFVTGCAMFVRREVFEAVGLFDIKFYLYYEDVDLCMRVRTRNYEVFYVPQAYLWHKNADTSGGPGSDLQSYYLTRNRLRIGMRYAPWKTKLALFRESMNILMQGTPTQKQAIGDFLRKKYGKRDSHPWKIPSINLLSLLRKHKTPDKKET